MQHIVDFIERRFQKSSNVVEVHWTSATFGIGALLTLYHGSNAVEVHWTSATLCKFSLFPYRSGSKAVKVHRIDATIASSHFLLGASAKIMIAWVAFCRQLREVFCTLLAHQIVAGDGGNFFIKIRIGFRQLGLLFHARSIRQTWLRVYSNFLQ